MRNTSTQNPIIPEGYTGKDYNRWIKQIYRARKLLILKLARLEIN